LACHVPCVGKTNRSRPTPHISGENQLYDGYPRARGGGIRAAPILATMLPLHRVDLHDRGLRARAVRYIADRDLLEIETNRDGGFLIPRKWIGALQDVPPDELTKLEVWPDGSAIELEARDIHISVDGLLTDVLPALLPDSALAAIFARRGGRVTSAAKRML
jgi:hypothetical protein